jgi:hypothetical protein
MRLRLVVYGSWLMVDVDVGGWLILSIIMDIWYLHIASGHLDLSFELGLIAPW